MYPANKTTFPVRATDDLIPASDFNTQADLLEEIQDALGYGATYITVASFIIPADTETHDLGNTTKRWLKVWCKNIEIANIKIDKSGDDSIIDGGVAGTNQVVFKMDTQSRGSIDQFGWTFKDDQSTTILLLQRGSIELGNNSAGIEIKGEIVADITFFNVLKGPVVKTPDGTKKYRLGVDNAGNVISTLVV